MIIEPFLTEMASRGGIISADGEVKWSAIELIILHAKDSHAAAWATLEKVTLPPEELTPENYRELDILANLGLRSAGESQRFAGKVKDLLIDTCKVLTLMVHHFHDCETQDSIMHYIEGERILTALQAQVGKFEVDKLLNERAVMNDEYMANINQTLDERALKND